MKKLKVKCFCCGKDFVQEYDEKKVTIDDESMFVCEDSKCIAKLEKLEASVQ
jgi:hypothetical protein